MKRMSSTTYQLQMIPDGTAGTRATLAKMGRLVKQYKTVPVIRELALKITRSLPNKSWSGEATAVQEWVRDNIRYVRDVAGVETLQSPVQTLRLRQGDCDDHATLTASLLATIGHPTRFVAIGFSKGHFAHVLTQTKVGTKWLPLETTENWAFGEIPKNVAQSIVEK